MFEYPIIIMFYDIKFHVTSTNFINTFSSFNSSCKASAVGNDVQTIQGVDSAGITVTRNSRNLSTMLV